MNWCYNCQKTVNVDTEIFFISKKLSTTNTKCVECGAFISATKEHGMHINNLKKNQKKSNKSNKI